MSFLRTIRQMDSLCKTFREYVFDICLGNTLEKYSGHTIIDEDTVPMEFERRSIGREDVY